MSEGRAEIHRIVWSELFPWLLLLRVFRQAMRLRPLLFAAAGVLLATLGWHAISYVFSTNLDSLKEVFTIWPWEARATYGSSVLSQTAGEVIVVATPAPHPWLAFLSTQPMQQLAAFVGIFDPNASIEVVAFLILCLLWAIAVWSLCGGGITRLAALGLARQEQIELREAFRYAATRWKSYFAGPTLPLVGVIILALLMALGGLFIRFIPYVGPFLGGLAWPLWLLGGLFMALLLLLLAVNWPLMWTTISCEGTDSFDSLGRAYGYLWGKPLRYLFYALVALVLGWLGVQVVAIFVEAIIRFSLWGTSWGAGNDALQTLATDSGAAAWLFRFWNDALRLLPTAFGYSYFWCAATAVYLLLRRDEDETQFDEIYREEDVAKYGLPPLETAATGVPQVVEPTLPSQPPQKPSGAA